MRKLIADQKETRRILRELLDTVGYSFEDKVLPCMERFALSEFGINAEDVGRKIIVYPEGGYDELKIFIEGKKNGIKILLVGKFMARPGKKDVKRFKEKIKRLKRFLSKDVIGFIVGYSISPGVDHYLKRFHPEIRFYYSYYFALKYRVGL